MTAAGGLIDVRAPAVETEGTRSQILRWLKSAGETVELDEPLLELETDKVTVELASPGSGVLREVLKQAEEEIEPGELLARIDPSVAVERSYEAAAVGAATGTVAGATADTLAGAVGSGGIVEVSGEPAGERAHGAAHREPDSRREPISEREPDSRREHDSRARSSARLSPAVKRLLAQKRLDAGEVRGTGPAGQITVDDVLRHTSGEARHVGDVTQPRPLPRSGPQPQPEPLPAQGSVHRAAPPAAGRRVPHSSMRKRIAEHMVRSLLQTAPHVTTVFEADFSAILEHRARHKDEFAAQGAPLTLTAYILAACVDAIRAVPESNASWTEEALEMYDRIDIGVGTALPDRGLIVPVVRDVAARSLLDLARELGRLVGLARESRLAPEDVRGGTFTISNHGVSGSLLAAPIVINQPQTAILGVGKVQKRPVVLEEEGTERIVVRPRAYLTLTIDHRVMDGHRANQFLEVLVHRLETWPASAC